MYYFLIKIETYYNFIKIVRCLKEETHTFVLQQQDLTMER